VTGPARRRIAIVLTLAAALALGALLQGAFADSQAAPSAVRHALAQTSSVQGAPQRTLTLSRVVIPPGALLASHHHLGTQVARIQSGALRYTVNSGSVVVRRGESDQNPRVVRKIVAGQTGTLRAGDWIVEQPSDIHQAANRGAKAVVVYLASLLKKGAPPATPVPPESR